MRIRFFSGSLYQRVAAIFVLSLFAVALAEFFMLRRLYFRTQYAVEHHLQHELAYRYLDALQPVLLYGVKDIRFAKELARLARLNLQSDIVVLDRKGNVLPIGTHDEHGKPISFKTLPPWLSDARAKAAKSAPVALKDIQRFLEREFNRFEPVLGRLPNGPKDKTYPISVAPFETPFEQGYLYVTLLGSEWRGLSNRQIESELVRTGMYSGAIGLLFLFAISGTLLYLVTLRFRKIVRTVHSLRMGELSARTELTGEDEISQLGQGIDEMAGAIEQSVEDIKQQDTLRKELVANVYHDFGGPLANIRGYLARLVDEHQNMDASSVQSHLDVALSNANLLLRMSRELLELSKLESKEIHPQRTSFDLAEMLEMEILPRLQPLAEEQQVELLFAAPESEAIVSADAQMLERVLTNLIENAIRYNEPEGVVRITLETTVEGMRVMVADTGCGIPEDKLGSIFSRFFRLRTDTKGTGLGLSIVQEMLRAHGSEISVASTVGEGTTFSFVISTAESDSESEGGA